MTPGYATATDLMGPWADDLRSGRPPTLYPVAVPGSLLAGIEVGPDLVTLFGGPPGAGKTALVMQLVCDALALTPALRALVANVEMPPRALLDRQLARLAGHPLSDIRHRRLTAAHAAPLARGLAALGAVAGRLSFLAPPFTTANVSAAADAFEADLLVLDYVQRFGPGGDQPSRRAAVEAVMDFARRAAGCGVAVLAVSAVGRQRGEDGRSGYQNLGLASFKESGELEYGADYAFVLCPADGDSESVLLKHVKSRHGEPADIPLHFDGRHMRFIPADAPTADLAAAVKGVWPGAGEGGEW